MSGQGLCDATSCGQYGACDPQRGCICQAGWSGTECTTDDNECTSGPCQNGARCWSSIDEHNVIDGAFISKYLDGYGNDRGLEVFNPSSASIELSQCVLEVIINGGDWCSNGANVAQCIVSNGNGLVPLEGQLAPGQTVVICPTDMGASIGINCDLLRESVWFNGDDGQPVMCACMCGLR